MATPPTLDPSTDAGWRAWDIYQRQLSLEQAQAELTFRRAEHAERLEAWNRDIEARRAIATAEAGMAEGQQAAAAAATAQAAAMVTYSQNMLASTAFSPEVAAEIIRIAIVEAPEDWINRAVARLGQYRTAFAGFFP